MKPSQVSNLLRRVASTIENSKRPDRNLVAEDLKRLVAILLNQPKPQYKKHPLEPKVWEFLWGRTRPWVYGKFPPGVNPGDYKDITDYQERHGEDAAGSFLFWAAFEDLDVVDWSPITDPEPIIQRTKEMSEKSKAQGFGTGGDEEMARENWETYRDNYMEGDIKKLVDSGIVDQATIDEFQRKLRARGL